MLGLTRDVTDAVRRDEERVALESRLRQAQKMEAIGTLAGGIAHDFNNILSALLGFAELAQLEVPPGSSVADDLDQVLIAGGRARDLVGQILTFSRRAELELKPVRLQSLLAEATKLLRASIPSSITFRLDLDQGCGPVMTDATQIHQIVVNLCTNAYHAMRERGGVLGIALRAVKVQEPMAGLQPGDWVQIEISDTGCGIPPGHLDRIFEPYFTTKAKGEGTGMGLSVVHGIVQAHGGQLSVDSELGQGTIVRVYLPLVVRCQPSLPVTQAMLPRGSERVLLVDDEEPIARVHQRYLEALGYHVTAFTDSHEALIAFQRAPGAFDACLLDMNMPGWTGDRLASEMVRLRPDVPILLCTGYSDKLEEGKALPLGIRELLMKPVSRTDMATALRRALDGHR